MNGERQTLRIVAVGHVDHGKSTLIGRLLYDTKSLPEGVIERVKRITKEKGKPFEYAYLLDALEEEQKQGITIDTTQIQFFTEKRDYIIIDAPGHKEFLKNMISGAASAEAALLIIDANEGIREQSKRHGYILSLLGIQKVYVIVNKMDLIQYSEEEFKKIQAEMDQFLSNLHVHPLKYIPVSAFCGENVTHLSGKMPWYQGAPVLEALDLFEKEEGLENKPLRFPIQDVYKFDQRRIIAGRIETGSLKVGDDILISPGNKTTKVRSIEYWAQGDQKETVSAGMPVGITVEDEFFNNRGEIISHSLDAPETGDVFQANIFWLGKKALEKTRTYKLKLNTQEVECEIQAVQRVIDASTLETIENAQEVKLNDVAEITIRTKHSVSFDKFKDNQSTGRFVLVDGFDVSGGGIITESGITHTRANPLPGSLATQMPRLVTRKERELRERHKGKVIWLTGRHDSPKQEIAAKLERKLFDLGARVYYLSIPAATASFEQARKMAEVARFFADSGTLAIVTSEHHGLEGVREIIPEEDLIEVRIEDSQKDHDVDADSTVEEIICLKDLMVK